jgi:hypothetical protein
MSSLTRAPRRGIGSKANGVGHRRDVLRISTVLTEVTA